MTTISGVIDKGQRLWLEGPAREYLTPEFLADYRHKPSIAGLSVTIAASDMLMQAGTSFDHLIQEKLKAGLYGAQLAMELLITDACHTAELLLPSFEQSKGLNGWLSLPSSPQLTIDAEKMAETVPLTDARYRQPNLIVSVAGLPSRLPAIESLIASDISVNIGMLFSSLQLRAVAESVLQTYERCVVTGRKPLSSVFLTIPVDRLLAGFSYLFPQESAAACVKAVLLEIGQTARNLSENRRWERAVEIGVQPPRLVFSFSDNIELCRSNFSLVMQIGGVCSMATWRQDIELSFLEISPSTADKARTGYPWQRYFIDNVVADIDMAAFADRLQKDEADSFLRSWIGFLDTIARKSAALTTGWNE